ncbi:MAG: DMT family transporter, partial [Acidobacteriota bacterium]|nr:DMT family transporter [Acidobacteriota bacterium]
LAPLWVALISVAFMSVRLRKRFWGGLALALAGAMVLGFAKGARWGTGRGELLGAIASIWYAVFTLAVGKARAHLSAPMALLWVVLVCLLGFGAIGAIQGDAFGGFPPQAWWALAGLGLVVQVLAWWLITWGLGHVSSSLGSVGLLTQAVMTVILGWLLLSEPVKPLQGVGAGLILAGIGLAALAPPMPKLGAA